jgi:hypothetical protein
MSNVTSTSRPQLIQSTTNTIYNLSMPLANTEYSQVLNNGTKKLTISIQSGYPAVRVSYVPGGTNTDYVIVKPGCSYSNDGLDLNGVTVYLQTNKPAMIAAIEEWT